MESEARSTTSELKKILAEKAEKQELADVVAAQSGKVRSVLRADSHPAPTM